MLDGERRRAAIASVLSMQPKIWVLDEPAANLDPVKEVMDSDPGSIRATLIRMYEIAGNPFMAGAGCEIPPGTPHENLEALCAPVPWRPNAAG